MLEFLGHFPDGFWVDARLKTGVAWVDTCQGHAGPVAGDGKGMGRSNSGECHAGVTVGQLEIQQVCLGVCRSQEAACYMWSM